MMHAGAECFYSDTEYLSTGDVTSVATPAPRVSLRRHTKWYIAIWLLNLNENLITITRGQPGWRGPAACRGWSQAEMAGPASVLAGVTPAGCGEAGSCWYSGPGRSRIPPTRAPAAKIPVVHQNAVS